MRLKWGLRKNDFLSVWNFKPFTLSHFLRNLFLRHIVIISILRRQLFNSLSLYLGNFLFLTPFKNKFFFILIQFYFTSRFL